MSVRSFSPLTVSLALISAIGLAACAAPPQAKVANKSPAMEASYAPPPSASLPPAPGAPAPLPIPSLADLAIGPQHFEGLEGKAVLAALGDPSYRRRETPAEVWQYYGPGCILDLFLYDEAPAHSAVPADAAAFDGKVAYAELRGKENAPAEAGCLSRLIDQRHNRRAAN